MTTLLRQQYLRIKKQFPDVIVMFRLGDFYETFDDDAKTVSEVCNIVLTGRDMGTGNRVPLAGVPYHAVDTYIAKLIQAGHKVAIVEQQAEEPVKGLMNREVTRVPKTRPRAKTGWGRKTGEIVFLDPTNLMSSMNQMNPIDRHPNY